MSIRLLEDPALKRADQGDRSHQLVDDMEAVFWTFLWLSLQYFKHSSPLLGGDENLFDLKRDPWELQAVEGDPRYQAVLGTLRAELQQLVECKGKSCRDSFVDVPNPDGPPFEPR